MEVLEPMDLSSLAKHLNLDTLITGAALALLAWTSTALWKLGTGILQRRKDRKAAEQEQAEAVRALAERGKGMRVQQLMSSMLHARQHLSYLHRRSTSAQVSMEDRRAAVKEAIELIEGGLENAREVGDSTYLAVFEKWAGEFSPSVTG